MASYLVAPSAQADIEEIWTYVARDNATAAHHLRGKFEDAFKFLGRNPYAGELRDEIRPGLRVFSVGNYVVCFERAEPGVRIIRVLHGARDFEALF
jgi:toxin ParE1/3/4